MKSVAIIFPHQLFEDISMLSKADAVYLVEEYLFFKQYNFHQQKLVFHRATMKFYESYLQENNITVNYIESAEELSDIRKLISYLSKNSVTQIHYYDTTDNWLEKRISTKAKENNIELHQYSNALFINTKQENEAYFKGKKKYFQADFYTHQRKKLNILIDENEKPIGGKWSFDAENRLKYPKDKKVFAIAFPTINHFYEEAINYVQNNFSNNYGIASVKFIYPTNFIQSQQWLQQFLVTRFAEFGEYEDAIVDNEYILNHSVLTPMLNVGLITPQQIINETLEYAIKHQISMNSTEGFIRQIIGWREFIRAVYEQKGTQERTTNYWKFTRKIPASFWDGTTGIEPVDIVIKKILATGYCHHIERLMVLGNFMLLCEFDPNEVYKWFMEMFIDAYDWVMVTNVYGMSQFADGGLMATKPYISGSNYLMKMSNFKKGNWQTVWDGLFWRFMHVHRDFFLSNPRLGMLINTFDKMPNEKRENHLKIANDYLDTL
jgi:deoxyribodipyrimidine photolyase-related protein